MVFVLGQGLVSLERELLLIDVCFLGRDALDLLLHLAIAELQPPRLGVQSLLLGSDDLGRVGELGAPLPAQTPQFLLRGRRIGCLCQQSLTILLQRQRALGQGPLFLLKNRSAAQPFFPQGRPFSPELFASGQLGAPPIGGLSVSIGPAGVQPADQLHPFFGEVFARLDIGQQAIAVSLPIGLPRSQARLPAGKIEAKMGGIRLLPPQTTLRWLQCLFAGLQGLLLLLEPARRIV